MNKILGVIFLMFVSVAAIPLHATSPQRIHTLSLEDAVRSAMKYNPELEIARLEVARSGARVLEAWGNALPSFDVAGRYTRTLKKPVFFADFGGQQMQIEIGTNHAIDMALTGRQILFNGAVIVGVGAAHVYAELASDLYAGKQIETVTKVRKAYYGALLAREVVDLMRSSQRYAEENLKNVQLMRRQGIVSEYDELRASVGVDNLRPSVMQSENNYSLALDALRNTIGLNAEDSIQLAGSLRFDPVDDSLLIRAEQLVLQHNPNLQAVNRQIDLNDAVIFAERSNYLPTIAAFGQYQYQLGKNEFKIASNDLVRSSLVGISISMNLFQGLQTRARVEQAQLEQRKSEEQRNTLERTLRTGVRSVIGNLQQARKRVEAQERTVETAERGYKIVTTRFLSNAATQLEVNDAQLALTQSKVNRIQATYDYLVAAADLDQLTGRLPGYAVEKSEQ